MESDRTDPRHPLVAVLGGGQLGRMLGWAGIPLGIHFRFLDPSAEAPAGPVGRLVVGELAAHDVAGQVARDATVVTYEWEGVPADTARHCETFAPVRPSPRALEVAQDRAVEKNIFHELDIATPRWKAIETRDELEDAIRELGLPAVLKTRHGGYDGKGQRVLREHKELDAVWSTLDGHPGEHLAIVETYVPFTRELSVIAVRGLDGTTACYPLAENHHRDGILHLSRAPAPELTPELQAAGEAIAIRLLDELGYVGVLAVELFEHDGRLLANEFAPRVHNSGHWTIEGAETSQFENHLRAILGWSIGSTAARGHSAMINCVGNMPPAEHFLAIPGAHVHNYGKQPRAGRKIGHVTVVADAERVLDDRVAEVNTVLASS